MKFSIKQAIKESWEIFKNKPVFFMTLSFIFVIINTLADTVMKDNIVFAVSSTIFIFVFSYIWLSISLYAVDGKVDELELSKIKNHFPTLRNLGYIILIAIITIVAIACGLILLIIPGIYAMIKLSFGNLSYVDRKGSAMDSVKYSWHITKGYFWTVLLTIFVVTLLAVLGMLAFGIGVLITYPLSLLLMTKLYRYLSDVYSKNQVIVEQPVELSNS